MKLEKQLTSLKYSKRLKELGVKQDSLWYWVDDELWLKRYVGNIALKRAYSAFTVAELGEMLPDGCEIIRKTEKNGKYYYRLPNTIKIHNRRLSSKYYKSLADCMAKMLIYLLENKLI